MFGADKPMQLNQAFFMLGGCSGYIPQPDVMRDDAFDPFDKDSLRVEPITIQLQVRLILQTERRTKVWLQV